MNPKVLGYTLIASIVFVFGGCAAVTGHGGAIKKFDTTLASGACDFKEIDEKIKKDDDTILWGIQGGSLARNCMDYNRSNTLFDKAEVKYKTDVDTDSALSNVGEGAKSVLVNNNVNEYEGNTYEKIMVNTYKGLNFLSMHDLENARIEFNRALDRQRRAKEYFEKEIKDQKEKSKGKPEDKIASNKKTQDKIYSQYKDIFEGYEAYPDFVNPFTTYMSALFFMLDGDAGKARDLFKESVGMNKTNTELQEDFKLAEKLANSATGKVKQKYAWVIYENGKGMAKDEIRIDIPLFLVTQQVYYTGIALPKMKERESSYAFLDVNGKKTQVIANMDNVIKAEFEKRFPGIMTEALLSLITKTIAQQQLKKNAGLMGGLLGAVYQGMTNKADVRTWSALPKNFQVARVPLNGTPLVIKNDLGVEITTVDLPKTANTIVYVRSESKGNHKIHTMTF